VHVTFGDYTPRQRTVGYLESYLHGGTTTAISASRCTCRAGRAMWKA
jgi:enamidase